MTDTQAAPPASTQSTGRLLTALIVGGITAILDTTIVAIGLHTLTTALHAPISTIQWVSTGYLLALAVAIPFVSWAQARFGGKRLWLFALGLFVLGSALCACAWNAEALIAFRVLQGLGGGIMVPLLQTLAMRRTAPESRARGRATASLPGALGVPGPRAGRRRRPRAGRAVHRDRCTGTRCGPGPAGRMGRSADDPGPGRTALRAVQRLRGRRPRQRRRAAALPRRCGAARSVRALGDPPGRAVAGGPSPAARALGADGHHRADVRRGSAVRGQLPAAAVLPVVAGLQPVGRSAAADPARSRHAADPARGGPADRPVRRSDGGGDRSAGHGRRDGTVRPRRPRYEPVAARGRAVRARSGQRDPAHPDHDGRLRRPGEGADGARLGDH